MVFQSYDERKLEKAYLHLLSILEIVFLNILVLTVVYMKQNLVT